MLMRGRLPIAVLLCLGAASFVFSQPNRFEDSYELALRTQAFTTALVEGDTREMYRMFTPAFRDEIPFARFDSAVTAWVAGRKIAKARRKVVDIKGLSGYVSNWIVFAGEPDYRYIYGSWLKNGEIWELEWLSRILDQSFQYGRKDTANLRLVAEAGLRYLLSKDGLKRLKGRLVRPDTIVMVRRSDADIFLPSLDGTPIVFVAPGDTASCAARPRSQYCLRFGTARIFGNIAEVVIDVLATGPGPLPARQGLKVFVQRYRNGWQFVSVARAW